MKLRKIVRGWGLALITMSVVTLGSNPPAMAQELFGSDTGLPLPRFVSLVSSRINVRSGPGKEYPIRWVFTRADLPVEISDEAGDWRKIVDFDQESGWIHTSLLKGDRSIMVIGEISPLYRTPSAQAIVTARLAPGVIGQLINCEPNYCYVDVDGRRGWLDRNQLWGVLPGETP